MNDSHPDTDWATAIRTRVLWFGIPFLALCVGMGIWAAN